MQQDVVTIPCLWLDCLTCHEDTDGDQQLKDDIEGASQLSWRHLCRRSCRFRHPYAARAFGRTDQLPREVEGKTDISTGNAARQEMGASHTS